MFTADEVYHDDVGLQPVRDRLAYYPRDVWLYLLIAGWWRVHPEVNVVAGPDLWATAARHLLQRNHQRNGVDSSDLLRRMRQERQEHAAQRHS
jgi:hypothetical protein